MGRPSDYSEALGDSICERIIVTRSITEALEQEGFPSPSTLFRWLAKHDEFREKYARAVELRAESDNEELRRVAYDMGIPSDQKRIIVDTLKWQQARASPKRYGDALQLKHADADGEKLDLDPVARATRLASIAADIERRKSGDASD